MENIKDIFITIVHNGKKYENVQYRDLAGCCFSLNKFLSAKDLLSDPRIINIVDDFLEKEFDSFIRFVMGQEIHIDDVTDGLIEILKQWGCNLVIKSFQDKLDKKNSNKMKRFIDIEKSKELNINDFPLKWDFSAFSYILKNRIMKKETFWDAFLEMYKKNGKIVVSLLDYVDSSFLDELMNHDVKNIGEYPMLVVYIRNLHQQNEQKLNRIEHVEKSNMELKDIIHQLVNEVKDLKEKQLDKSEQNEPKIKNKDRFASSLVQKIQSIDLSFHH